MTNEEKPKIYAALAAPPPEHRIQRTEGRITGAATTRAASATSSSRTG
jgi:hypothetical protein